jgi:hypothetical protein
VHPAPDEHRLAGAGLIGSFNKRHRHRNLTITVLFARVPTSIAAAPRRSPTLPRPCVAATPIAGELPRCTWNRGGGLQRQSVCSQSPRMGLLKNSMTFASRCGGNLEHERPCPTLGPRR